MARGKLPETPVEPREIKTAVDIVAELRGHRSSPGPLLAVVGGTLATLPQVRLDRLSWRSADASQAVVGSAAAAGYTPDAQAYVHYQVAEVAGHLAPFDGDYRGAIAAVDHFADALRGRADVTAVEVLQYPLDLRSDTSVSGSTTGTPERLVASFRLKLTMGVPDGSQES